MLQLIRRYSSDEEIIERVLGKGKYLNLDPEDPFMEYNLLILILLEELNMLRQGPVYRQYEGIVREVGNDLRRELRRAWQQAMGYSTLLVVIALAVGLWLGSGLTAGSR